MAPRVGTIRPSAQPLRTIRQIDTRGAFGAGVGAALENLGQTFEGLAEEQEARDEDRKQFDMFIDLEKMNLALAEDFEAAKDLAPLGAEGFTDVWRGVVEERQAQFRADQAELPPELLSRLDLDLQRTMSKFMFDSFTFTNESQDLQTNVKIDEQLGRFSTDVYNDENMLGISIRKMENLYELSGLSAEERVIGTERYLEALQTAKVEGEIARLYTTSSQGEFTSNIATPNSSPNFSMPIAALGGLIGGGESGQDYGKRFDGTGTGAQFTDFAQHPNTPELIPEGAGFLKPGDVSTAAGYFMFTFDTWEDARKALKLPNFEPENQDRAFTWYVKRDYKANKWKVPGLEKGRSIEEDLLSGDPRLVELVRQSIAGRWSFGKKLKPEEFFDHFVNLASHNKVSTGLRPLELGEIRASEAGPPNSELAISVEVDGQEMVLPTLWMGPAGVVEFPDTDSALQAALNYEGRTGKRFPRFDTVEEATAFSEGRSARGGVSTGPLAQKPTEADLLVARQTPDIMNDPDNWAIPIHKRIILAAKAKRAGDSARIEAQQAFLNGEGEDYKDFLNFVQREGKIPDGTRFNFENFSSLFDPDDVAKLSQQVAQALEAGQLLQATKSTTIEEDNAAMAANRERTQASPENSQFNEKIETALIGAVSAKRLALQNDPTSWILSTNESIAESKAAIEEAEGEDKVVATAKYVSELLAEQERLGVTNPRILSPREASIMQEIIVNMTGEELKNQPAAIKGIVDLWGDAAPQVLEELRAEGLSPILFHAGMLFESAPGLAAQIAALPILGKEARQSISAEDITDIEDTVLDKFAPFSQAFTAGDPSGLSIPAMNEFRAIAEELVMVQRALHPKANIDKLVEDVLTGLVTNNYHIVDGGQIRAYIPKEIGTKESSFLTDPRHIEDVAEAMLTTEGIAAMDLAPLSIIGLPDLDQQATDDQVLDTAFWVTGPTATELILVIPTSNALGGGPNPVINKAGQVIRRGFDELMAEEVEFVPSEPGDVPPQDRIR